MNCSKFSNSTSFLAIERTRKLLPGSLQEKSLRGRFSLREEHGLRMQMTKLRCHVRLSAVAHSLHGLRWRAAADRSWIVDVANNLSHLFHPSEGCGCSLVQLQTATVFSPKASSLGQCLCDNCFGWFQTNQAAGPGRNKSFVDIKEVLPKVLAWAQHLLNYNGTALLYLKTQYAYKMDE